MGCAEPEAADIRVGSRDAERVRVAATLDLRSRKANCLVLLHDISATGARIETQSVRFEPGDTVGLRLPYLPTEQVGEIAWTSGTSAGVRFYAAIATETFRFLSRAMRKSDDPASAVHAVECPAPVGESPDLDESKRMMERAEVAIGATCRTSSGRRGFVAMIDLTPQGCCLLSRDLTFAPGQQLTLQPECLAGLKATVQWSKGPLTGTLFDKPLHAAVFSHLASTYPWPLPEPVKDVLGPHGQVSETVLRELSRLIARTEKSHRGRDAVHDVLTTRPPIVGSRPGIAARAGDSRLARLFLG